MQAGNSSLPCDWIRLTAKAHVGFGLVKAYHGDFKGGVDAIKQAGNYARNNEERIFALVGTIRVNLLSHATCLRIGTECTAERSLV